MTKPYFILAIAVSMLFDLKAQNVLLEDFVFPVTDSLENLGGWYRTGINSQYNIKVVSPGLTYTNYVGSGLGNACQLTNAGNGDVLYKPFSSPITSGAAYNSFMLRVDNLPATVTEGTFISFNPNTGGTNLNTNLFIKRLSGTTFNLGIRKVYDSDKVYANTVFNTGTTYLVVLKYAFINGANNDTAVMYVFESGVPATEPNVPTVASTSGTDFSGQGSVHLSNNYAQDGLNGIDVKIDGIRVGNSWATSVFAQGASGVYDYSANTIQQEVSPNPFRQDTKIAFQLPEKGWVSVHVYDASGALCTDLLNANLEAGAHELDWNAARFPAGIYTCTIRYNGEAYSRQLLKIN